MQKYPNRLAVSKFEIEHKKVSQAERERSKQRNPFTNLYVEKLPIVFQESDVFNLFSKFGTVKSIKLKKPTSNVQLSDINLHPCSAYVNMATEQEAKEAMDELNWKQILPGANPLKVDYYQRANRFLGAFSGLERSELINNNHFRVLFIKGLFRSVTRDQLREECEKYGIVESLTLKTKIENHQVVSRGIGIVQYATKGEATEALNKLLFISELGDFLDIDYYQSKESRMQRVEQIKHENIMKFWNQTAAVIGPFTLMNSSPQDRRSHSHERRHHKKVPVKRGRQAERPERVHK